MLVCKFTGLAASAELHAATLTVRGAAMYANGRSHPVAVHRERHWEFAGAYFVRFDVAGPVTVRLIAASGAHGDICLNEPRVWFADGVLHAQSGHVCCLDEETDTWIHVPSGDHYREIVLSST